MPGRAKPPFGIQFGRKMAAIIGKITVLAKSFIQDLRKTHCKGGIFELLDEVIVE